MKIIKNYITNLWEDTIEGNLGIGFNKEAIEFKLSISKDLFNKDLIVLRLKPMGVRGDGRSELTTISGRGNTISSALKDLEKSIQDEMKNEDLLDFEISSQCEIAEDGSPARTCEEGYVMSEIASEFAQLQHAYSQGEIDHYPKLVENPTTGKTEIVMIKPEKEFPSLIIVNSHDNVPNINFRRIKVLNLLNEAVAVYSNWITVSEDYFSYISSKNIDISYHYDHVALINFVNMIRRSSDILYQGRTIDELIEEYENYKKCSLK